MGLKGSFFLDKEKLEVSEPGLCWTEGRAARTARVGKAQTGQQHWARGPSRSF